MRPDEFCLREPVREDRIRVSEESKMTLDVLMECKKAINAIFELVTGQPADEFRTESPGNLRDNIFIIARCAESLRNDLDRLSGVL